MIDMASILRSPAAQEIFRRHRLEAVYLFGSYADGRADAASDVDLAVLFPPEGRPIDRFDKTVALDQELKPLVGKPLEIVPLNDANPLLAFEAVIRGKTVYARDEDECILYELRLRHHYEEFCHIQDFFTQAMKEKLGIA
ncbi:MAG: nucleotidyltransferase domain-containing protein [Planctomycetes bacterium]|nr:nucleotidyltransferase domain-containing protein [Planctomycetota bacterium]